MKPQKNAKTTWPAELSSCIYQLRYAKKEAQKIINSIYYNPDVPKLERKYLKVYNALATDARNHSARVL